MHAIVKHVLIVVLLRLVTTSSCRAQAAVAPDVAPMDAVTTIVEAFREHPVVAISEGHGDERFHAFLLGLIRDRGSHRP